MVKFLPSKQAMRVRFRYPLIPGISGLYDKSPRPSGPFRDESETSSSTVYPCTSAFCAQPNTDMKKNLTQKAVAKAEKSRYPRESGPRKAPGRYPGNVGRGNDGFHLGGLPDDVYDHGRVGEHEVCGRYYKSLSRAKRIARKSDKHDAEKRPRNAGRVWVFQRWLTVESIQTSPMQRKMEVAA